MHKTEFAGAAEADLLSAQLARASIRFFAAVAALVGISLLLASL